MKNCCHILRRLGVPMLLAATAAAGGSLCSCDQTRQDTISISADPETFPTMRTLDVSTFISDSGYTRYHITAPIWLMFEEAQEPTWKFPEGLDIVKFDDFMHDDGTLVCDSATYFSARRLWRLDSNVRMKNVNGDRFLTEQLFWDQNRRKIFSDSFIHIERSDRIIEGVGFESNEAMTDYTVRHPMGIFPVENFGEKSAASPTPSDSTKTAPAPKPAPAQPAASPAPPAKPQAAVASPPPSPKSMRLRAPKPAEASPNQLAK